MGGRGGVHGDRPPFSCRRALPPLRRQVPEEEEPDVAVFQNLISKFCASEDVMAHLLPCKLPGKAEEAKPTSHLRGMRRLFSEEGSLQMGYCAKKHKVPLLSLEALHHLHIFIFVLAVVHVRFCISLPRESF
ncbi:hypothetical protein ACFX15_030657 [Malus domestica]